MFEQRIEILKFRTQRRTFASWHIQHSLVGCENDGSGIKLVSIKTFFFPSLNK